MAGQPILDEASAEALKEKLLVSTTGEPVLRVQPHRGQEQFLSSGAKRRVLIAHRRWGKNWVCIMDMLRRSRTLAGSRTGTSGLLLNPRVVVWFVFPTYTLADELWLDLKRMIAKSEAVRIINSKPMLMELRNGTHIHIRSAENPEDLVSAGIDLLYMIEAARMQEAAWRTVRPTLTSEGRLGMVAFNSTPLGQNWLAREYARCEDPRQTDWQGWRIPAFLADGQTRHELSVMPASEKIQA